MFIELSTKYTSNSLVYIVPRDTIRLEIHKKTLNLRTKQEGKGFIRVYNYNYFKTTL